MRNSFVKKNAIAILSALSLTFCCAGCGGTVPNPPSPVRRPRMYEMTLLYVGIYDGDTAVGGYHSYYDGEVAPKIELEVGKTYDVRVWGGESLFEQSEYDKKIEELDGRKHSFDPAVDVMESPIDSRARINRIYFGYDEKIMYYTSYAVTHVVSDEETALGTQTVIQSWSEHRIIGYKEGETDFDVAVYGVDYYSDAIYYAGLVLSFVPSGDE